MYWPWNSLFFCLIAFDLHLQAEWVFCSAVISQVVMWCTFACILCTCLQLVCLGSPQFGVCLLFLVAYACEMPKLMASLTLILFGRALESLQVECVTTFGASVFSHCVHPWYWISSCVVLAVCNHHCSGAFGLFVWASQVVFSSYIYQLAILCTGASIG